MRAFALLLFAAGCIQAQLQPCGDLLCPVDSVCLPNNTCATKESIEVCTGKVEGDTCTTALFTGSCATGVCTAPVCGDGVVSGSEQCDGPVSGVDCVEYGFDTGIPTCSDRCGLDVVGSCVRFGWERIVTQPVSRARASNGRLLVESQDHYTIRLLEGSTVLQEQTFDPTSDNLYLESIDINGSVAAAGQYGRLIRSDNGGPFVAESPPVLADVDIYVAVGDDGSVYGAAYDSGTRIYRKAPGSSTWEMLIDTARTSSFFGWLGDGLYVGWDDGEVQKWQPGGAFTRVMMAPAYVYWLALRPGGGYYIAADNNQSYEVVGTTFTPFGFTDYSQIFGVGSSACAGGDSTSVIRQTNGMYELFDAPIYGNLVSDGTDLYVYGNGIYRFTGTQFGHRDGTGDPAQDVTLLASGEPAMATIFDALVMYGPDEWTFLQPHQTPLAIAGASSTDFYAAEIDDIEHYVPGTGFATTNPPSTLEPLDMAWSSTTLYAVGKAGVSARYSGSTWSMLGGLGATCDMHQLATATSGIYAAGTCGAEGVIWKLAGTTWSEIHRTTVPLVSLSIDATDNIYATGAMGSVTRIGGTWNDAAGPAGISISATKPDDIWVAGGIDDLVRWDGVFWSRVRLVGAASPQVLATDHAVYFAGATVSVLLR